MVWKNIVKTALIGTDRSELSEKTLDVLQKMGVDVEDNPANVLLEGATLYAQMRKAGFQPQVWKGEIPLPALQDETKICSRKSTEHLAMILMGTYENVLDDFIQQLIFNKKTLPPELLPELLEKCRTDQTLWQKLRFAIGERGYWLMEQNEEWYALNGLGRQQIKKDATVEWEEGTKIERLALLQYLRSNQPDEALELIESTWTEDDWQHRVEFLKILETNLSLADEPFLEKCLDGKRKDIRKTAISLLEKIEGSELRQRTWERLKQCIHVKDKEGKRPILEIELPEICDEGMIRDGVDPRKKWAKGGLKASYFAQMFLVVSPSRWEDFFGKEAAEVLEIFAQSEWAELLIQASIAATVRHGNENWIEAVGDFYFKNYKENRWADLDVKALLRNLPEHLFNRFAIQELKDFKIVLENSHPLVNLLTLNNSAWDKNLTLLLMKNLRYLISQNIDFSWNYTHYRNMLDRAAYGSETELYDILNQSWANDESYWTNWGKEIDNFLQVLKFRREVAVELGKS